ncbi:aspartyl/asparaginyl beta-hydroxylase domain-containing protein [Vibrio maritimus]
MDKVLFSPVCVGYNAEKIIEECLSLLCLDWTPHVNNKAYKGSWDVLPLRVPRIHTNSHEVLQSFAIENCQDWQNLDCLNRLAATKALLDALCAPIHSVRLMRLHSGSRILPHRDNGLSLEHGYARLHLPIIFSNDVTFQVANYRVPMELGQLWYIDASELHEVFNDGTDERINLVIDCEATEELTKMIFR